MTSADVPLATPLSPRGRSSALQRAGAGYLHSLFAWQRRRGRALGIANGATGAVTFVQRFGGALNLHPHVHSLVPDGPFVPGADGAYEFMPLPAPTQDDLEALTERVARRLTVLVERYGGDDDRTAALVEEMSAALRNALAAAVRSPRGSFALDEDEPPTPASPLCARVAGFTLHAAQSVPLRTSRPLCPRATDPRGRRPPELPPPPAVAPTRRRDLRSSPPNRSSAVTPKPSFSFRPPRLRDHADRLTLSSHLTSFARPGGAFVDEVYAVVGAQVDQLPKGGRTGPATPSLWRGSSRGPPHTNR